MINQDINPSQWRSFLDDFSSRHLGQSVTLEILATREGDQILARDLPLVGLVDDPKGSEGRILEIIVGDTSQTRIIHEIRHPANLRLAQSDDGQDVALEFESTDAPKTLLRFGPPEEPTPLLA